MEYPTMETGSLFVPGIKRCVRDKRISKTAKLNVSLASKIKTKILNNSSIFKISLKHNNRALAQALSREKENSRRITTEKMLLQKEVEKLNFENTFLRLKLNNLNKKLIDIEALMNNNLITAIEMSTLSEFHQNSLLLPTSKKKRISKQCKLIHPFARVPLTLNDDDDDDDDDDDIKKKMQHDSNIISKTSSDTSSSVPTKQILSTQHDLELLFPKENNKNMDGLADSEHIFSIIDKLPKENHPCSDQSLKSSLMDEMKNPQSTGDGKEKISVSKITTRKKRLSSWELNNPPAHSLCVANLDEQQISNPELDCNNEINDISTVKKQRNSQCFPDSSSWPANEPAIESINQIQASNNFLLQKTVYDDDMDLTASEVSKIVTVSTGTKNASNNKLNDCKIKTFRKVKYSSSGKKRERSKSKLKNADVETEERIENELERKTIFLDGKGDPEEVDFVSTTEQPTQLNMQKKISLPNDFDPDDKGNTQYNEKKKNLHVTNEQEETYSLTQNSGKFQQETKCGMIQSSVACSKKKASRQTIIIQKFEKGNQFLSQKDKETISENLEDITEFQTVDHTTKDNGSLCDYETQNILDLKKHITDNQSTQQNELKANKKLRQRRNRKTEIISEVNQINGDDTQDIYGQEKGNFFPLQTQGTKKSISDNLEVCLADVFQSPAVSTSKSGKLCDPVAQNLLGLPKQITDVCLDQQNKMKVNKSKHKINRKTEIISEVNQISGDDAQDVCGQEKGNFFSFQTQDNKETISDNLEVYSTNVFQSPAVSTSKNGKLCDSVAQNLLGLPKQITDVCLVQQNKMKVSKSKQKINRKTEIISEVNQISGDDAQDVCGQEKGNFFSFQTQDNKETISDNVEVYSTNVFQSPAVSTSKNGKLCNSMAQNLLGLSKQITDVCLVQQNKMKVSKSKQKINRKTEIISEVIRQDSDKNVYCPEKESNHLLLKDTEIIPKNLEDPLEFQISVLSTTDSKSLSKSQNVCEMKKQIHDPQSTCQNRSKIDEKLKQNLYQKAEILKISQINENIDKDMYNSEKGNLFSLTQKHKNIISKNSEDFNEIENADAFTRGNENLSDFEAVKKHVTDKTPSKQNKRKINKQRQKVSQKRKITFEMSQVHEDNVKDIHSQENCTGNLDFTINKSKQRLECQDIIGGYDMKINSNEKETFSISSSYKQDEKHEKESLDRAMIILAKGKNKPILHLKDSLQTFASESGLRHSAKEEDCDPGNQMKPRKSQKRRTKILNKSGSPFVEMMNEEECRVQTQNKTTSKSRKRKTFIRSSDSQEVMEITDTIQGIPVESKKANKEKSLENEEIVKLKSDFHTKMFKSFSQIYSPSIQDSSFNSVHEDSMPLSVSSHKSLILKGNLVQKSSQIFQENDDINEKMKGMNLKVNQRTKISGVGDRTLQDLTNTNFVSNNTDKPENNSDLVSELPSRKRRCIPLSLKEPSLKGKLRR